MEKTKNALKKWYKERSKGQTGGGICDDCGSSLIYGKTYLRPGNYLCCENCTDKFLNASYIDWESAISNLNSYFGPGIPSYIQNIANNAKVMPHSNIQKKKESTPENPRRSSNMPLDQLKHIFIFTETKGRSCLDSPIIDSLLKDVTGASLSDIIGKFPLDIIPNTKIGKEIATGFMPFSARAAISSFNSDIAKELDNQTLTACVRPMKDPSSNDNFALFLAYDENAPIKKEKKEGFGAQVLDGAGCFIATKIYGSYNAQEVIVLRNWRDSIFKHLYIR